MTTLLAGVNPDTTTGVITAITPGSRTRGAWVSFGTLASDASALIIDVRYENRGFIYVGTGSGTPTQIAIYPLNSNANGSGSQRFKIELPIPAGTEVSLAMSVDRATPAAQAAALNYIPASSIPTLSAFTELHCGHYNVEVSNNFGNPVAMTDATAINTKSPWYQLVGQDANDLMLETTGELKNTYKYLCLYLESRDAGTGAEIIQHTFDLAIGEAGSESIVVSDLELYFNNRAVASIGYFWVKWPYPAGTKLNIRYQVQNADEGYAAPAVSVLGYL